MREETGYDDPVCVPRPDIFLAYKPPKWYADSGWMALDGVEMYMRSIEWMVGRTTNATLTALLDEAINLNRLFDEHMSDSKLGFGDDYLLLRVDASILIPLIQKEMLYRKQVDAERIKV